MKLSVAMYAVIIVGMIFVFLHYATTCPPNVVEYRYLPRDLEMRMMDSAFGDEEFETLFDPDPWINRIL